MSYGYINTHTHTQAHMHVYKQKMQTHKHTSKHMCTHRLTEHCKKTVKITNLVVSTVARIQQLVGCSEYIHFIPQIICTNYIQI